MTELTRLVRHEIQIAIPNSWICAAPYIITAAQLRHCSTRLRNSFAGDDALSISFSASPACPPSRIHFLILAAIWLAVPARAATRELTFERDVRPILKQHCFQCHGEGEKLKGGVDLRLRRFMDKPTEEATPCSCRASRTRAR